MAGHCRRYANLRADKTGDCEAQYGVCLSAATSGVFGEVGVGVFENDIRRVEVIMMAFDMIKSSDFT